MGLWSAKFPLFSNWIPLQLYTKVGALIFHCLPYEEAPCKKREPEN